MFIFRLLDEWAHCSESKVSSLLDHLHTLGREDAVQVILSGCSLYRYVIKLDLIT